MSRSHYLNGPLGRQILKINTENKHIIQPIELVSTVVVRKGKSNNTLFDIVITLPLHDMTYIN